MNPEHETRGGWGLSMVRTTLIPLFLMLCSPPFVLLIWVICHYFHGDLTRALSEPAVVLAAVPAPSLRAAALLLAFLLFQLLLLVVLPGPRFAATPTPMGNRPTYRLNGVPAFVLTHAALALLVWRGVPVGRVVDWFGELLATLNVGAAVVTELVYLKGLAWPSSSDSGRSGHGLVWDLWQGTELHPEVGGVSLKQLINCRFAMMSWSLVALACAVKQWELYGALSNSLGVSAALQVAYCFKFFVWESGYFNSIDIIHDRFGFYICWGCLTFLPSLYNLTSLFLVTHPRDLPPAVAAALLLLGLAAIWANYDADRQRQRVRATGGRTQVWGREPALISASYVTGDGKKRSTVLLASGWWGLSRHMNYAFELLLSACWCLPAGGAGLMPYFYLIFLVVLLVDRVYRDELRCQEKYGEPYRRYCQQVRYKILPYVY